MLSPMAAVAVSGVKTSPLAPTETEMTDAVATVALAEEVEEGEVPY